MRRPVARIGWITRCGGRAAIVAIVIFGAVAAAGVVRADRLDDASSAISSLILASDEESDPARRAAKLSAARRLLADLIAGTVGAARSAAQQRAVAIAAEFARQGITGSVLQTAEFDAVADQAATAKPSDSLRLRNTAAALAARLRPLHYRVSAYLRLAGDAADAGDCVAAMRTAGLALADLLAVSSTPSAGDGKAELEVGSPDVATRSGLLTAVARVAVRCNADPWKVTLAVALAIRDRRLRTAAIADIARLMVVLSTRYGAAIAGDPRQLALAARRSLNGGDVGSAAMMILSLPRSANSERQSLVDKLVAAGHNSPEIAAVAAAGSFEGRAGDVLLRQLVDASMAAGKAADGRNAARLIIAHKLRRAAMTALAAAFGDDPAPDIDFAAAADSAVERHAGNQIATAAAVVAGASRPTVGLFDVAVRRAKLAKSAFGAARQACLAIASKAAWKRLKPIAALQPTDGYGSDRAAQDLSLAVMVLAGRALAGDDDAEADLITILRTWARARAFLLTVANSDPYFSLKRSLLPLIVAFDIINRRWRSMIGQAVRTGWTTGAPRRRPLRWRGRPQQPSYLADSVLTLWGGVIGDKRSDRERAGGIFEGARRHAGGWHAAARGASRRPCAVVSPTDAGELDADRNRRASDWGRSVPPPPRWAIVRADAVGLFNGLLSPTLVDAYAEENFKPGPQHDPRQLDLGFLVNRGNGRHYMAFAEALLGQSEPSLSIRRLAALVNRGPAAERPLIDEFIGGNATCFFWEP